MSWMTRRLRAVFVLLILTGAIVVGAGASTAKVETLPEERGGQDVLGTRFPARDFDRWINAGRKDETRAERRLTLYRWWTNGCRFCERTLPAIEALRAKHEGDGLRVVAVYHPKPPREVTDQDIRAFANALGFHGDIAVDQEWAVLKEAYLSKADRRATSISLLVDADGVIRFVHPGTEYFPSDDPADAQENADFELLEKAIATLLHSGK